MALPLCRSICFSLRVSPYERAIYNRRNVEVVLRQFQRLFFSNRNGTSSKDPGELFIQKDVQAILRKVTGLNLDVVYREKPTVGTHPPKYRLLTNKQLKEIEEDAFSKAVDKLQMPPVMKARENTECILSEDGDIEGFDTHKLVFTDITYGLADRERTIVIREPSGQLRLALPDEKDRILQTYFPIPGRMLHTPKMFEEDNLENLLDQGKYLYILDAACAQFEPDNPTFISVSQRTYEHININKAFNELRFSRHFGGLTFYLAFYKNIDALLCHMLKEELLSDAVDIVDLFCILHPESDTGNAILSTKHEQLEKIQIFLSNDSRDKGAIELALQRYLPVNESSIV